MKENYYHRPAYVPVNLQPRWAIKAFGCAWAPTRAVAPSANSLDCSLRALRSSGLASLHSSRRSVRPSHAVGCAHHKRSNSSKTLLPCRSELNTDCAGCLFNSAPSHKFISCVRLLSLGVNQRMPFEFQPGDLGIELGLVRFEPKPLKL